MTTPKPIKSRTITLNKISRFRLVPEDGAVDMRRRLFHRSFVKSILRTATALLILGALAACAKPLPIFGEVPDFHLTDQTGKSVAKADLQGSVWIADFIYTGCSAACPMMTLRFSGLSKGLGPGVRLVSFTVDPETDTPAR